MAQGSSSLGRLRDDQRRYEEAGALHERAVRIHERVLGPRHPDLATSLFNLARHHALQGHRELAATTGAQAHEIRLAVLGPEHPDTIAARRALDRWSSTRTVNHSSEHPGDRHEATVRGY